MSISFIDHTVLLSDSMNSKCTIWSRLLYRCYGLYGRSRCAGSPTQIPRCERIVLQFKPCLLIIESLHHLGLDVCSCTSGKLEGLACCANHQFSVHATSISCTLYRRNRHCLASVSQHSQFSKSQGVKQRKGCHYSLDVSYKTSPTSLSHLQIASSIIRLNLDERKTVCYATLI